MTTLQDAIDEYEFLDDRDDRHRMIIELGRSLEPMPEALKTEATKVRGCLSNVWAYPVLKEDGGLHFLADSDSQITKGIIALVLLAVQDLKPAEILRVDIPELLAPFHIDQHLSSRRSNGIPNMIALIRATAERYA